MTAADILQVIALATCVIILAPLVGRYMARVFSGRRTGLSPVLEPLERTILGFAGLKADHEQHWTAYGRSLLLFNLSGGLLLYAILRLQHVLPLNPAHLGGLRPDLAFNTAVSFVTNTNWQAYDGETTLSPFSQMVGLGVQNFLSAATGMTVLLALTRGFSRHSARTVGSFYVDLLRTVLYVLLPLSLPFALFLVWQGVPQTLIAQVHASTLEGARQTISLGPVASQEAIKMLGTNGGGFFGANSGHPFENPTPLSAFAEMLAIILLPASLVFTFGRMIRDPRQGWALFAAMGLMLLVGIGTTIAAESRGNPAIAALGVDQRGSDINPGGNMEGKEVRFGPGGSALWAALTTATASGSVNSSHDSFTPLGGMTPLVNMMLGEVIFGGIGCGLYGMLVFVILAVFIAGLMVGRTPEYLGKKIEAREIKLAMVTVLVFPLGILGFSAAATLLPMAQHFVANRGPHALSEILYAFTSAVANNGSAFGGVRAGLPVADILLGFAMLIGRFLMLVPVLAIAGSLAAKRTVPETAGTLPTHSALFVGLLIAVVVVIGGLTFFPVLSLGPIAEHFALGAGTLY